MSAFRKAVLSVAPERLEQFTIEMKKNINDKETRKRHSKSSSDKNSSFSHSKNKKCRKHSTHSSDSKKTSSDTKVDRGRKSGSSRRKNAEHRNSPSKSKNKDRKHRQNSPSDRREKKKNLKNDSDFDPKDLDLSVPILPLSDMAKDRKLMLDTAFSIVKGPKLTSMLPDILKLTPIDEIKQLCEEQLNVMSSKRILHVLAGTEMQSSSGTDSSDDDQIKTMKQKVTSNGPNGEPVKETEDLPHQDPSLQTNLVDSTTSDHHSGPSMLFPSAVTTAQTTAKKISGSAIPPRKIDNDNKDDDDVSTSTEPNFIYNEEGSIAEDHSSSDTEEGEVQTSESEEDDGEEADDAVPVEGLKQSEREDIEEPRGVLDFHPNDDVLVEVEEIEEQEEEHVPFGDGNIESLQTEEKAVGNQQTVVTVHKSEPRIAVTTNVTTQSPASGTASNQSNNRSGKTQLEILELELRARAIKSLMKAAKAGILKPSEKK